jgi:glycerol-3-phosphate cytidylyltransferase-like family protein
VRFLIVGVSTDELIEKEKGNRPVIPFEERLRVIESISYVDKVIPQVDKNKQRIVDLHNIDAISVGDDWKGRFPKTTCPVEYLPYTKSVSSTILKNTLKLSKKN